MPKETQDTSMEWRAMVRVPAALGQRIEEQAKHEMMPTAVLLRRWVKEGVERDERKRKRDES